MQHHPSHRATPTAAPALHRRGMSLVEVMLVVAIIGLLMAVLLPALGILRGQTRMATSQSNMRQVATLLSLYDKDNRGYVVPSRFDYSANPGRSQVRSASPAGTQPNVGPLSQGSWTDILWTVNKMGPLALEFDPSGDTPPTATWDYRFDSPDYWAYKGVENVEKNIFRSTVPLAKPFGTQQDDLPTPFGLGAGLRENGQPGYFAANNFFDSVTNGWYTNDMIKRPGQSVYLVDSRAGETIATTPDPWNVSSNTCEVEFRYVGDLTLMLYMDGHVTPESKWTDLTDLQQNRQIRVENLDKR